MMAVQMLVTLFFQATINALEGMRQPIPTTMHRGHIPGAKNILEQDLMNENTNCFLKPEEIRKGEFQTWNLRRS